MTDNDLLLEILKRVKRLEIYLTPSEASQLAALKIAQQQSQGRK